MGHFISILRSKSDRQKQPESSARALQTCGIAWFTAVNLRLSAMTRAVVITSALFTLAAAPTGARAQKPSVSAAETPSVLTGKKLKQRLKKPVSVSWTDAPLAARLKVFAAKNQFAIFIDRRIDPDTKINTQRVNVTIEQLLLDVASEHSIGMCQVDDLIYIGPTATAHVLPILWGTVPRGSKSATRLEWDTLSRPRELLESISQTGKFKLKGIEQIPHDLWGQGSLPPLTSSQQAAIVAVGFGMWPSADESDPRGLQLVPFKAPNHGKIEFFRSPSDVDGSGALKESLKQKFSDVKFQVSRGRVRMSGPPAAMYAAKAFLIRRNQIKAPDAKSIHFTLKTSANRLQILRVVARQTGRELVYDPSLGDLLDQQVKIECHQINLNELVDQILSGSGLQNEVTSSKIQILAP